VRVRHGGIGTLMGALVVLAVLGAACSKGSASGTGSSSGAVTLRQGSGGLVFTPSSLTVKKGQSIEVSNVGSSSHTFTITGKGIDVVNDPGQSQTVSITLAPGTYPFICRFHVALGMKGTLTVTA
jgi:plastocyanin